jgi:hypothetical protein
MKKIIFKHLVIAILFSYYNSYSQNSNFVVTELNDTINVEKFNIKAKEIKVKLDNGEKKNFSYEEIKALYDSKKNKYFQKIQPALVEYPEYSGTVFFAERLTDGKVKIFNAIISHNLHYGGSVSGNRYSSFYIGIYDSKPELINNEWYLTLTKDVYKILKLYLHSNEAIQKKLDDLFFLKEEDKEIGKKIIDLVNEYNEWATSEK